MPGKKKAVVIHVIRISHSCFQMKKSATKKEMKEQENRERTEKMCT